MGSESRLAGLVLGRCLTLLAADGPAGGIVGRGSHGGGAAAEPYR